MIRKRILLASLLKPASDTRLYEKIGLSLAKLPDLEVHVAGFATANSPAKEPENLFLHPIFDFKRISTGRLAAQRKFWRLLHRLKPDLILVATHELLFTAWLYSRKHNAKLVYDVQENYFLNLTTQGIYKNGLGKLMGHAVRQLESFVSTKVDHFFLAEESYAHELPFLGSRYTVVQNKYQPPQHFSNLKRKLPVLLKNEKLLRLLYSGTISKLYGVLEAIQFTRQLRAWVPEAELTIAGYCADSAFLQELQHQISCLPYIRLVGGSALVPHHQILEMEQAHHVGLLPYRPHPSTFRCIPTKLFEYQANGLVIVAQRNPLWQKRLSSNNSGLSTDFLQPINQEFISLLLYKEFYTSQLPEDVFWKKEEVAVQKVISQLLTK